VKKLSRLLLALANTRSNAAASGRRFNLCVRYPGRAPDDASTRGQAPKETSLSGVPVLSEVFVAEKFKLSALRGQLRTPFRAPPLQHQPSGFGCHARAESMGSRPL